MPQKKKKAQSKLQDPSQPGHSRFDAADVSGQLNHRQRDSEFLSQKVFRMNRAVYVLCVCVFRSLTFFLLNPTSFIHSMVTFRRSFIFIYSPIFALLLMFCTESTAFNFIVH